MDARHVRFGHFELLPEQRRLLARGRPVPLGARAFDLLLALVAQPGVLIGKQALLDQVWGQRVVEEANLTVQVSNLRRVLGAEAIATVPGFGYRFELQVESAPPARHTATAMPAGTAPAPMLFGRAQDRQTLVEALERRGVVTLTGVAGVGKTALARSVAHEWPAGAVWIDLAPLTDASMVAMALARALAVPVQIGGDWAATLQALAPALGPRLLVLDNAEHLLADTASFAEALQGRDEPSPLLVTSQARLGLAREWVIDLQPLALPAADAAADASSDAMALFVQRIQAVDNRFRPEPGRLPVIAEICRRLDGLPLALEMAAVRVPALGLVGVRDALEGRFAVLRAGGPSADPRHRTLEAALDWSHSLLSAPEQQLLRACAVLSGGFGLELLRRLSGDEGDAGWAQVETLARLVDRSLVAIHRTEPPRYRLLETVRAYAVMKLRESGEEPLWQARHAQALHRLFVDGPAAAALDEHDNARAAVHWACRNDPALAIRLANAISAATTFVSWRRESASWLEACAVSVDDASVDPADRAQWWLERSRHRIFDRDAHAGDLAREALARFRALADDRGIFDAIVCVVRGAQTAQADLPALCDEAEAIARRHPGWPPTMLLKLAGTQAHACQLRGDHEGNLAQRRRELALARSAGHATLADAAESNVVAALTRLGRHEEALAAVDALIARIGDQDTANVAYAWQARIGILVALGRGRELRQDLPAVVGLFKRHQLPLLTNLFALTAAREGRPYAAALLVGHARQAYESAGRGLDAYNRANLDEAESAARAALPPSVALPLIAQGRALDDARALEILMAEEDVVPEGAGA